VIEIKSILQLLGTFAGSVVIYSSEVRWETLIGIVIVGVSNYFAGSINSK
jgi:hypothetical protein